MGGNNGSQIEKTSDLFVGIIWHDPKMEKQSVAGHPQPECQGQQIWNGCDGLAGHSNVTRLPTPGSKQRCGSTAVVCVVACMSKLCFAIAQPTIVREVEIPTVPVQGRQMLFRQQLVMYVQLRCILEPRYVPALYGHLLQHDKLAPATASRHFVDWSSWSSAPNSLPPQSTVNFLIFHRMCLICKQLLFVSVYGLFSISLYRKEITHH